MVIPRELPQSYRPSRDLNLVNSMGDYVEPWLAWFAQQRCLAERYRALEAKVRKVFTIEDIDPCVPYMEHPDAFPSLHEHGRLQPSAAEFMAHITVEVATNMDLGAHARTGFRIVRTLCRLSQSYSSKSVFLG